jgi:hypothetical protein
MNGRLAYAALLVPLICAKPVCGQNIAPAAGPTLAPPAAEPDRGTDLALRQAPQGLSVSARPFTEADGSRGRTRGLIGNLPIARNLNIGLGLLEVTRTSPREKALRRVQPMKDVGGTHDRIAAVGLKLSF